MYASVSSFAIGDCLQNQRQIGVEAMIPIIDVYLSIENAPTYRILLKSQRKKQ
jgi:hypothetical protein